MFFSEKFYYESYERIPEKATEGAKRNIGVKAREQSFNIIITLKKLCIFMHISNVNYVNT